MRIAPEALIEPAHLLVHHGVAVTRLSKSAFCAAVGSSP
jgi:hypothetical protein